MRLRHDWRICLLILRPHVQVPQQAEISQHVLNLLDAVKSLAPFMLVLGVRISVLWILDKKLKPELHYNTT